MNECPLLASAHLDAISPLTTTSRHPRKPAGAPTNRDDGASTFRAGLNKRPVLTEPKSLLSDQGCLGPQERMGALNLPALTDRSHQCVE